MAAIVPGVAVMSDRIRALGYVEVETRADSILGPARTRFRGHQFRYSTLEDADSANRIDCIYNVTPRWGGAPFGEGYRVGNVVASYVHAHWASNPAVAEALISSCASSRVARQPAA
jgi:cobyrinic acid a,c-diamide synthase